MLMCDVQASAVSAEPIPMHCTVQINAGGDPLEFHLQVDVPNKRVQPDWQSGWLPATVDDSRISWDNGSFGSFNLSRDTLSIERDTVGGSVEHGSCAKATNQI
jgi:hypothetical protein